MKAFVYAVECFAENSEHPEYVVIQVDKLFAKRLRECAKLVKAMRKMGDFRYASFRVSSDFVWWADDPGEVLEDTGEIQSWMAHELEGVRVASTEMKVYPDGELFFESWVEDNPVFEAGPIELSGLLTPA